MVSVMTTPLPYAINMEIFDPSRSHSLPRIDTPAYPAWQIGAQAPSQPEPISATSTTSGRSWLTDEASLSPTTTYYQNPETSYQPAHGLDRTWLFSPPSGFRKGLKKTDLRPIDAPTKQRSHLPKGSKAASPYTRPEMPGSSRQRSTSIGTPAIPPVSSSPEQLAKLERRRKANAEAQRLSRQRKEETLQALRADVERLSHRVAGLDSDLQQWRNEKDHAEQVLQREMAEWNQLQAEKERKQAFRRQQAETSFQQLQVAQNMTSVIGFGYNTNNFWA